MKGRKPKADAIRRQAPPLPAKVIDTCTLDMPIELSLLPYAEQCWHIITDDQTRWKSYEAPLLSSYCIAYAGMRQAVDNMTDISDGTMEIVVRGPMGGAIQSPNWKVFTDAVKTMRSLSGVLGLDTLTAERLALTKTATASIAADIPGKIMAAMRDMPTDG